MCGQPPPALLQESKPEPSKAPALPPVIVQGLKRREALLKERLRDRRLSLIQRCEARPQQRIHGTELIAHLLHDGK